jgi:hypothetical protein
LFQTLSTTPLPAPVIFVGSPGSSSSLFSS